MAQLGDKPRIVVDGKEGKLYEGIAATSLVFSPDSQHFAYIAKRGNGVIAIVDDKESQSFDGIREGASDRKSVV